ncbi:OFA family MFS transporter [Bacillaceae bacterium Marseille-Q3522]|nr:OFA family MFS transporter [Bacillaceae bacterium Marseille-Q3522]
MVSQIKTNRWFVFVSAWIIIFFVASVAVFSVFSAPMTKMFGWSSSDFTLAYSYYMLIFSVVAIFAGRISDKFGAKKLMYVGGVLFGLGWFLTGYAQNLTHLYLAFGLCAGGGAGSIYNSALSTALKWFPDKGGKISGLLLSSAAIGPFIISPISNFFIEQYGVLNAFKILGILFMVAICAVAWLMDSAPANYRLEGWKPSEKQPNNMTNKDYEWKEMLATPLFYLLLLTLVCASIAGTMMVSSASVIAQEQVGLTAAVGAVVVSASTFANLVGRLCYGAIYDKIGDFKTLLLSLFMTIAALLLISIAKTMIFFIICIIFLGMAFGGLLVVFPPITRKSFGVKNLGINYAIVFLGYGGGSYVGPKIASYYRETTGTFTTAYILAAVLTGIGVALVGFIMYMEKKGKQKHKDNEIEV